MAPKGRWSRKEKKDEDPAPKGPPVLPVRRTALDMPDAICVHIENYFTIAECERYMEVLRSEIDWKRQEVTLNKIPGDDKTVQEPRLTAFMSDPGICYEYSKRENVGIGWHPAVLEIKEKAERALDGIIPPMQFKLNSCQMNRYDGPRSSLGMHCDNEPDLVPGAPIVSVSFGATRDFRMMRKDDESKTWTVTLKDGSFLLMAGEMQDKYLHGVPPGGEKLLRFNLTFRCCIPRAPMRSDGQALRAKSQLANPDLEENIAEQCAGAAAERHAAEEQHAAEVAVRPRPGRGGAERKKWRGGYRDATLAAAETPEIVRSSDQAAKPGEPALNVQKLFEASRAANAARKAKEAPEEQDHAKS